jgi:hypothetical protein
MQTDVCGVLLILALHACPGIGITGDRPKVLQNPAAMLQYGEPARVVYDNTFH